MSYLISQIIPSLLTLKILGDVESFKKWLQKTHPEIESQDIFEGYRFSLNCCLNCFVDGLADDESLGIENDFLFKRSLNELIPIHEMASTCEKVIFLKNLKPTIKSIIQSKDYAEINNTLNNFHNAVTKKFETIFDTCVALNPKINIDNKSGTDLLLIDYAHTFLVQINNNGPTANFSNPLAVEWIKKELLERYLAGYKYAIQFLWYKLLGESTFRKAHVSKIHLADSWRDYTYLEQNKTGDPIFDVFNNYYDPEKQTCFDVHFHWIMEEITKPLSKKYKFEIFQIDSHFQFSDQKYDKVKIFGDLLDRTKIPKKQELSWSKKIEEKLYWYSFEIIDTRKSGIFFGIPSFITMLAGTVTLHIPEKSEFSKILVVKFTHPHDNDKAKRDYSYGILIDSKSAAGHYSSGWVIYQNTCGDYSGFSGSEHKEAEFLIAQYKDENKIELQELTIPLREFKKFTNKYTKSKEQFSILKQNKLIPDIIQKSRAHLLELFTYYICSKNYSSDFKISLNTSKKSEAGEEDIVICNEDEVILIECKLNPQSYDLKKLSQKLKKKLMKYPQKVKSCQLWCWFEISPENRSILEKIDLFGTRITIVTVSNPKGEKLLHGVDLKLLKEIMQEYLIPF